MNKNLHKSLYLSRFQKILSEQNYIVIYQNLGLKTKEVNNLKYHLSSNGLKSIHIKNNLLLTLLRDTKFSSLANVFEGSCLVCYGSNEFTSCKQSLSVHTSFPQLVPLGAYLDGSYISAGQFSEIRELSSKDHFHLSILNEINLHINQIPTSLNAISSNLTTCLVKS